MNLVIKSETDNAMLSRKEIVARITFDGVTPSRKDVQAEIAKATKAKPEMVIVTRTLTDYGHMAANIEANIYSDEKAMAANERKNLVEKHAGHEPKTEEEGAQ